MGTEYSSEISYNIKYVYEAINEIKKIIVKNNRLKKDVKNGLKLIADSGIDKYYYDDYDKPEEPGHYRRKYDLYNVFSIVVNDDIWKISYDYKNMKKQHRVSNEYIFNWMFIKGYHGGAYKGEGHPNPGEPWWRYPISYTDPLGNTAMKFAKGSDYWYKPAIKSEKSPYEIIERNAIEFLNKKQTEYSKNIEEPATQILNDLIKKIS